ncbi:type II toxin-antitoxin system toxin YacB [Escherichia coli]|nr:type II toxin-antitoxin system toxin YacB [Escherichia coli]
MEIFWTMLASQDRKHIREYIAEQNLMAAIELDERIGYSASSLAGQPYKGRNGRVEGTRELVIHPHFVLVYEVDSQWGKVYILRVLHTAQKYYKEEYIFTLLGADYLLLLLWHT